VENPGVEVNPKADPLRRRGERPKTERNPKSEGRKNGIAKKRSEEFSRMSQAARNSVA
jgi:hypothetical protein